MTFGDDRKEAEELLRKFEDASNVRVMQMVLIASFARVIFMTPPHLREETVGFLFHWMKEAIDAADAADAAPMIQ